MNRIVALFCLVLMTVFVSPVQAQENENNAENTTEKQNNTWRHFENLVTTIDEIEHDLDQARKALVQTEIESERKQAQAEVNRLNQELSSLQLAWEMWATGGVDLELFRTADEKQKFDWKDELESVFEPILVELRRLTERPRKIERLRSDQGHFQQRLSAAEAALGNVISYRSTAPSPELVAAFSALEKRWSKRRDDLQNRLDLINFELDELLSPSTEAEHNSVEALKELFSGRLLNLFLAILAAVTVYGLLWQGNRFYSNRMMRRGTSPSFATRVIHLALLVIGSVLAVFAAMMVFYVRGDWILLGLMIIILVGMALALQRFLPGYMSEAKLLLNIGAVREGERIVYNGLPWKVQALRVYSMLVNPVLTGGTLRLPLSVLSSEVSRPFAQHEPWFPTRENDYVVLADDTFGRVIMQSPETVQLRVLGAITTYSTSGFLDMTPRNLSLDGFSVILRFGIDYQHQAEVTDAIRDTLESYLSTHLKQQRLGNYLQKLTFEFAEAGASSLDFIGIFAFDSAAAESYLQLNRLLQKLAVDACNANGWVIPFSQMTVHLAHDEDNVR